MIETTLPAPFRSQMESLLGAESSALFAALENNSPTAIRFNPFKIGEKPSGRQVPWSRYGYYLEERPQFTLDPLFHGGAYYVQEPSSMFIETLFRAAMGELNQPIRVLDLCAAPGGKSTLLATLAGAESVVIANEVIRSRAMTLCDNVKKWGIGNVVVTNNDPSHFTAFEHYFDLILVDAPCSGEGMFRKSSEARSEWSEGNVRLCAARQQRILSDIWGALRPGGVLIYSTCTFNTLENEENLAWLAEEYDCEGIKVAVDPTWGVVEGEVAGISTFRLFPHRLEGEGLFATVLRKGDSRTKLKVPKVRKTPLAEIPRPVSRLLSEWVNQSEFMHFAAVGDQCYGYYLASYPVVKQLAETLTVLYGGIEMGQVYGVKLKPEHPLALFHDLRREELSETELELLQALNYLRRGDIGVDLLHEGMNLVTYQGLPLGWVKRIGSRANNLYPSSLRIATL